MASRGSAYRVANRETINLKQIAYRKANRESVRAASRAYYAANRETILGRLRENYHTNPKPNIARSRRRFTGFTQQDWDTRFVMQDGLCAICRTEAASCADHSHATGQKRGLLCGKHNRGLGMFGDNPKLLEAAATYLRGYTIDAPDTATS